MSMAALQSLLKEFGAAVGIPDLEPDDEQRCNMMFDDVALSFELGVGDESVYIYALLGAIANDDAQDAYAELLHSNYAFATTRGSTLSIDPQTGGIVLMREEQLDCLRLPRFEAIIEDFVTVAEQWMKRIANGDFKARNDGTAAGPSSSEDGMMRV